MRALATTSDCGSSWSFGALAQLLGRSCCGHCMLGHDDAVGNCCVKLCSLCTGFHNAAWLWSLDTSFYRRILQVDVGEEEEAFAAVTTACLNVLVLGVETKLDVALTAMQKMNWSTVDSVRLACCGLC